MNPALTTHAILPPIDASIVAQHAEARRKVMKGLEPDLLALRRLDTGARWRELSFFISLWVGGLLLNYLGLTYALGWGALALRVSGTLATAIATNTFILFMHEGMHNTFFANRFWNRWASVILGATFCLSFTSYRVMHLRHHNFLGDARDPDDYHNYTPNRRLVWVMHYLRLIIGPYLYIVVMPILAARYGTRADRQHILVEYLVLASFYLGLFLLAPSALLVNLWLLPLMIAAHLTAIRGLCQHGITNAKDPYLASRSILANRWVAFCLLNENYHLEHHLFPEIPSYRLAQLHRLIWPRLPHVVTGTSYLAFLYQFVLATLRMDERPIGFADLVEWEA